MYLRLQTFNYANKWPLGFRKVISQQHAKKKVETAAKRMRVPQHCARPAKGSIVCRRELQAIALW
jgi:hypothetical protein